MRTRCLFNGQNLRIRLGLRLPNQNAKPSPRAAPFYFFCVASFSTRSRRSFKGSGLANGPLNEKSIRTSVLGEYAGHSGRPLPLGLPVLAKFTQYALAAGAVARSASVRSFSYRAATVPKTNGISVACGAPGHFLRIDSATYEKRYS